MSKKIAIVYFSGSGHTKKVAEHVMMGAKKHKDTNVFLINCQDLNEQTWGQLDEADAIIFGSPTFMGGIAAQYKAFIDSCSGRWYVRKWLNKIAAGFVNSGGLSGDKGVALTSLLTNAMQHGMIWVGQSELSPGHEPVSSDVNRISSYTGLMTQSNNDSVDKTPPEGDLKTAEIFGLRIATITAAFKLDKINI